MSDTNGSPPAALSSLASIIIPCCGMVEYTKLLVPSLLEHTRQPYELIFIDIGSLDGTADYLEGLAAGLRKTRVTVVRAETDLQINDACREALATAAGEYVVLLNNDTIVADQWLNQLIGLAKSSPGAGVGLVGPMSNYVVPPQLVEVVPYRVLILDFRFWIWRNREMAGPIRTGWPVCKSKIQNQKSKISSSSTPSPPTGATSTPANGSTPSAWAGFVCSSSVRY